MNSRTEHRDMAPTEALGRETLPGTGGGVIGVEECQCRFIDGQGHSMDISVTVSGPARRDRTVATLQRTSIRERREKKAGDAPLSGRRMVGKSSPILSLRCTADAGVSAKDRQDGTSGASEGEHSTRDRLIHTNRMEILGMAVSEVTHEINNANGFILFNASLLADLWRDVLAVLEDEKGGTEISHLGGLPWKEAKEAVARLLLGITEGSKRIQGTIGDLRGFAHGKGGEEPQAVNMNAVVEKALRMVRGRAKKEGVSLHAKPADELPVVWGREQELVQVTINLIVTVLAAVRWRGSAVEVSTRCEEIGGQNFVVLSVREEEVEVRAGETEGSAEASCIHDPDRRGIDPHLSISRSIVEDHGGSLTRDSDGGKRVAVHVRIPSGPQGGR